MTHLRRCPPGVCAAILVVLAVAGAALAAGPIRPGGESRIDESSPDDRGPDGPDGPTDLEGRLRAYAAGSLARYDEVKSASAGFRRQGWFPSCSLRDAGADVEVGDGPGGRRSVTVHVSCARRDVDQQLVTGPLERFLLPGADRRFFGELVAGLADLSPEVGRARVRFWFAALTGDGRLVWEDRGSLAITAEAARRVPAGGRTREAVWPLLEEDTVPAALWPLE